MCDEKKAMEQMKEASRALVVQDSSDYALLLDSGKFNQLQRAAGLLASSSLVPVHFQKQAANVAIAIVMAKRLDMDLYMLMQNMYIVHGKPGFEAKLVISLVNSRGPFRGPIQWEIKGEGMAKECRAFATHKQTGETCEAVVSMDMAAKEGWLDKSGSKWKTMPDMMLRYRSATFLARLYCPEVIMGMSTADELIDGHHDNGNLKPAPVTVGLDTPVQTNKTKTRNQEALEVLGVTTEKESESKKLSNYNELKLATILEKAHNTGVDEKFIRSLLKNLGVSPGDTNTPQTKLQALADAIDNHGVDDEKSKVKETT